MSSRFLDQRRWFVALVSTAALLLTYGCAWMVLRVLPGDAGGAQLALVLLVIGASGGWVALLTRMLPILLLRVRPRLEG